MPRRTIVPGNANSKLLPLRLKIVQTGDPVLRQAARPLLAEEITQPEFDQLIGHMRETMRDAPGVGLAAPQIGLPIQVAVIEDRPEYSQGIAPEKLAERERVPVPFMVLVNPQIVQASEEMIEFFEGCLSVAGFRALVKRARHVTVEYLDETGTARQLQASGWFARILQHEIDHLRGHLYIDRMEPRSFATIENLARNGKDRTTQAVRQALGLQ